MKSVAAIIAFASLIVVASCAPVPQRGGAGDHGSNSSLSLNMTGMLNVTAACKSALNTTSLLDAIAQSCYNMSSSVPSNTSTAGRNMSALMDMSCSTKCADAVQAYFKVVNASCGSEIIIPARPARNFTMMDDRNGTMMQDRNSSGASRTNERHSSTGMPSGTTMHTMPTGSAGGRNGSSGSMGGQQQGGMNGSGGRGSGSSNGNMNMTAPTSGNFSRGGRGAGDDMNMTAPASGNFSRGGRGAGNDTQQQSHFFMQNPLLSAARLASHNISLNASSLYELYKLSSSLSCAKDSTGAYCPRMANAGMREMGMDDDDMDDDDMDGGAHGMGMDNGARNGTYDAHSTSSARPAPTGVVNGTMGTFNKTIACSCATARLAVLNSSSPIAMALLPTDGLVRARNATASICA